MKGHVLLRLAVGLVMVSGLRAQSFNATIGSSETYGSSGLIMQYRRGDNYGWVGVGSSTGFRYGSFYSTPIRQLGLGEKAPRLEIGDQSLSALLDVDEYDTHAFTARGASFVRKTQSGRLQVFGGTLTEDTIQPYLHFATTSGDMLSQTPVGAITWRHRFSPSIQMHSLNLFTGKVTSIQSVGWKPSEAWRFAGAGGLGLGSPYLSGVSAYEGKLLNTRISYTLADHGFHREEGPYSSSENLGLNARVEVSPTDSFRAGAAHEHLVTYMPEQRIEGQPLQPASTLISTFDSAHAFVKVWGFRVNNSASVGKEDGTTGKTTTEMVSFSRKMSSRWTTFGALINMKSHLASNRSFIDINQWRLSPRLALRQNYTWMDGQNSFSIGGDWKSNPLTFSVDEETYVSPLAAIAGRSGMFQAWTFSIRLRMPHDTTANVNTFMDPTGTMQWGGYLEGLRYDAVGGAPQSSPTFSRYVVRGLVVDQSGKGVWGIALSIGGETVISDQSGAFFLHVKSAKPLAVKIEPESSLQFAPWRLSSAPPTVRGWHEESSAEPLRIILHMGGR